MLIAVVVELGRAVVVVVAIGLAVLFGFVVGDTPPLVACPIFDCSL